MDEQDKEAINELKRFAIIVLAQEIEKEDLSFEEQIRHYLMAWREELQMDMWFDNNIDISIN